MSTERKTDEVNLSYISKSIEKGFKNLLKICISIFLFYKRKWLLFLGLLIVGIIGGYFLDTKLNNVKSYTQDIIIEPKYDSKEFIYDFIVSLKHNLKDAKFLKKINLDSNTVKNLKNVEINPMIRASDVLDNLHKKYGDKEYFYRIIESYDEQTLENDKYRNFYKYHHLVFVFRKEDSNNITISKSILNYLYSNEYYQKVLTQKIKQTEKSLKKNKETLNFIEEYLDKLNKAPIENKNDLIMIGNESEIPTISALLVRKQTLLNIINSQENILTLDDKLFDIVEMGDVVSFGVALHKKMVLRIPLLLFLFLSGIFLLKQLPDRLIKYVNS
ncbi:hypothetical protein [uncultured Aquimarina sp.]|uniref:hypothetical protein n=1 Tax=uncultured Aquimarina sp. TaxID=575652 RepID=UPI002615047A|nr:hypothetical protein [uncultured Aquimarina sp.]